MALHFLCIWRSQWHDKGVRGPGDVRAVITSTAPGSSVCWRRAHRSREPRENSRSTITPCVGTGGTMFRQKPARRTLRARGDQRSAGRVRRGRISRADRPLPHCSRYALQGFGAASEVGDGNSLALLAGRLHENFRDCGRLTGELQRGPLLNERLRGPQHDAAVCDELGAWSHPETWDMLQFGLRLGGNPRCLIATTPRPTKLIRELLAREGRDVAVTRGSTYENRANLAAGFFDQVIRKYEGTRLGRQELNAELLEDTPGALWSHGIIEAARQAAAPNLARIVVAIDPAASSGEDADETGVVVVGRDNQGHGYVLADRSEEHTS